MSFAGIVVVSVLPEHLKKKLYEHELVIYRAEDKHGESQRISVYPL